MAINYRGSGEWALHVRALAIIESGEDIGKFGDGYQAANLLQQHPDFFIEWYSKVVNTTDTWDHAQIKAAAAFLDHYIPLLGLDLSIEAYNLGVKAVESGERNADYLNRWSVAFQKLRGQV